MSQRNTWRAPTQPNHSIFDPFISLCGFRKNPSSLHAVRFNLNKQISNNLRNTCIIDVAFQIQYLSSSFASCNNFQTPKRLCPLTISTHAPSQPRSQNSCPGQIDSCDRAPEQKESNAYTVSCAKLVQRDPELTPSKLFKKKRENCFSDNTLPSEFANFFEDLQSPSDHVVVGLFQSRQVKHEFRSGGAHAANKHGKGFSNWNRNVFRLSWLDERGTHRAVDPLGPGVIQIFS